MQRLGLSKAASGPAILLGAVMIFSLQAQTKRVPLKDHGFSMEVPRGWNIAINPDGLPTFTNFPFSKLQPQLLLPERGAIINVIAWDGLTRRSGDETLSGWSRLDARGSTKAPAPAETLAVPQATGISEAIVTSFDEATYGPDDQPQHDFSVYWTFHNEKFSAHLFYIAGDPKGRDYEETLKEIVRSVRPLRAAAAPQKAP